MPSLVVRTLTALAVAAVFVGLFISILGLTAATLPVALVGGVAAFLALSLWSRVAGRRGARLNERLRMRAAAENLRHEHDVTEPTTPGSLFLTGHDRRIEHRFTADDGVEFGTYRAFGVGADGTAGSGMLFAGYALVPRTGDGDRDRQGDDRTRAELVGDRLLVWRRGAFDFGTDAGWLEARRFVEEARNL